MENIPLIKNAAEKEGAELQERAKSLQQIPEVPIDPASYQEAHDQISAERIAEMKKYIEIIGGDNNLEYRNLIIEFMARNYRVEELESVGLKSIRLFDEIRYYKTISEDQSGDNQDPERRLYDRAAYEKAKESGELPTGDEWLRARARSRWRKNDTDFGTIEIFDPYDYPYETPEHVESASKKDQALVTYLLAHEVGHFVYSKVYLNDDISPRNDVSDRTEFGGLLFTKHEGKLAYNYDNIEKFMESPFTPYLRVRVKAIKPLYDEAIRTQDPKKTARFMLEFSEYYSEFFTEAAALAKTKKIDEMDETERYFVACYDQAESIINQTD